MALNVSILRETREGEKRVAIVPSVLPKFQKLGVVVTLQSGAGEAATFPDKAYSDIEISDDAGATVADADIVLAVQPPSVETVNAMRPGAVLISFLYPGNNPEVVEAIQARQITAFAMEKVPRISRAQSMDALSSQAALSGYYAPLLGAIHMPKILPMMTTAVGSLRAAKVLVMGLGVAGLQALATSHRLGAITEGYDVRPETKEQAASLGAQFVDTGVDARGEGGYARDLTDEEKAKVAEVIGRHIADADMIITTASIPGRPSPKLISAEQIASMKPGAVIVDLGAEGGGNCEGTKAGEVITIGPATIIGAVNLPSALAQHASELYAKNILSFLSLIVRDGEIVLDEDDEVIADTMAVRGASPKPSLELPTAPSNEQGGAAQ